MAQIIFTGTAQATSADAFLAANTGSSITQTKYFDDQDTANGQSDTTAGVLEVGDILYDNFDSGTGLYSNIWQPGSNAWWYVAAIDSAVEVQGNPATGEVLNITANPNPGGGGGGGTTTTTAAPIPTYSIIVTDSGGNTPSNNEFNEGSVVNVTIQSGNVTGNTLNYTVSGSAQEDDFSVWPLATGTTQGTLDFTNATTVPLQFTIANDVSSSEGNETLIITLDAQDNNGNNAGQTVTINILDTSVNQPPALSAITDSVTQNGTGNDFVDIDLSQGAVDPESDPLTFYIKTLPSNGTLRDPQAPTTDLTTGVLPYEIQSSGDTIRYYPGTSFVGGSVSFTWSAEDGLSNQQNNAQATVSVNAPQNQPPVAANVSPAAFQAGTVGIQKFFTRSATDEDAATVTFNWSDASGNTLPNGLADINPTLLYGQVTQVTGETFVYTTNTTLGPNDSSASETLFYYMATDSAGLTSAQPGQVQFQLLPPGNVAPSFDVTPPSTPTQITNGLPFIVQGITATDPEGHTVTISVQNVGGTDTGASATFNGGNLTVTGSSAGSVSVTLRATDQFGAFDAANDITYNFTTVAVAYRGVRKSAFSNSDTAACSLERPAQGFYYYSTAPNGTTFLSNLAAGAFLYSDTGLQNKIIPSNASFPWVSVEETVGNTSTVKALKLNASDGAIEEVLNCTVTGGNAWPILIRYSQNGTVFCDGVYEENEAWQNVGPTATIVDVVAANGQLFSSEYYANQYLNNNAPASLILPNGAYTQAGVTGVDVDRHYFDWQGGWTTNPSPVANDPTNDPNSLSQLNRMYECAPDIIYATKSINVFWNSSEPTNVSAFCAPQNAVGWNVNNLGSTYDTITLYYRQDQNDSNNWTLLDLAKNQIIIYSTQTAAENQDYNLMFPSSVLLDNLGEGFVLFDKDDDTGYPGSYRWYAFSPDDNNNTTLDNLLEVADSDSVYGQCEDTISGPLADYIRPEVWDINTNNINIVIGNEAGSVYFAFYGCDAKLDPGIPGGEPYFPMYIVDGMVEKVQLLDVGTSYINTFIQTITNKTLNTRAQVKVGGECLTYTNAIVATNIEDAVDIMQSELDLVGGGDVVRAVSINAIDLGFGSEAVVSYRSHTMNLSSQQDLICHNCKTNSNSWDVYEFPIINDADILNRTVPNFDLEENYVLDNVSKPLLRTNPKLSTNAKIVANSTDKIFIESIDATKELASVEYKKYELNPNGQYSQDLYKFYKNSSTPASIMYATRVDSSDFAVQESYDKQIEEVYHYGTTYNYSKLHSEDFRMLAPIWLDKDIPKKFVVFRVNDPVGEADFDTRTNFDNIQEFLKNSEIIKTFDLTTNSSLGKYIRNHVNSESFPRGPLQFNFEKREKSNFKGIDLEKGGFTAKGEYLHKDFVYTDNPLISSNATITDGFERNKLACANLLNLEFLFDDDNASDYSINRYFGLYVNDIDSGYGNLRSAENGNLIFESLNSYINEDPKSAIPAFKQISGTPTLGYLSISDEFYKISSKAKYDVNKLNVIVEDSTNAIPAEIKTAPNGKSIDIVKRDAAGFDFVKGTITRTPAVNDRFVVFESRESSYSIKFLRLIANEAWQLKLVLGGSVTNINVVTQGSIDATGIYIKNQLAQYPNIKVSWSANDKKIYLTEVNATLGDLQTEFTPINALTSSSIVKVEQIQTSINLDNSTFFATHGLPAGTFSGQSFSSQGTNAEIAKAIASCINGSSINFDVVIADGSSEFYIKSKIAGYRLLQSGVLLPNANAENFVSFENLDERTTLNPNGLLRLDNSLRSLNAIHFMNGGNSGGKSVLVTQDSVSDVVVGDMLATGSVGAFNRVIDIVDDIATPNTTYKKLVLDKVNVLESGEQKIYAENIAKLGLFSAYDIHDMNFDFYDISNSELKELEYETSANINYEPERSATNTLTVFGTDYDIQDVYSYFTGISDILPEETLDAYNEVKLFSEYDRLQENNIKEFAVMSRVVPNINKWVLKDTLTVREQPYYLNANEAFGRTNFSPDFNAVGRDRLGMTHEWFYMDNLPKYLNYNQYNDTFSYVNFLSDFKLTAEHFKSTSYNYFDRFMVTEGFETKNNNGYSSFIKTNLEKKYTLVNGGNDVAFANTVFKGIKVDFKNRKEFVSNKATEFVKSSEFNGYKFSTLVLVRGGSETNSVDYEVIQNKKFKFVVFLITLSLDDLWIDGALNRKLLYEMNHSFVWNHETQNFSYSDVNVTGALNLNDINFTDPSSNTYRVAKGITHSNGGEPQFLDQINPDEDDNFGFLQVKVSTSSGDVVFNLEIESVDDQDQITLASSPQDVNGNPVNVSNIAGYIQNSAEYVYKGGGKNAFTAILDQLAVGSVSNLLKLNDGEITYTTIEEDGQSVNNRFEIEFENGVEIIKQSSLLTVADEDKPKTFKLKQGDIGYNIVSGAVYYPFLIRQNGYYTVDTRPVVTFTDTYSHFKTNTLQTTLNTQELAFEEPMYKHSLTSAEEIKLARDYYKRYNRCKTAFNLGFIQDYGAHDAAWGIIKNHFYRKVNESNPSGVTKLSTSTDKLPLYPLIGEVAIDKKDVNVFKSSWDKNYYTRSLSGGLTEAVPGTFETKEERSYLGSTIMKVKDSYSIINFTTQTVKTQEEQDLILANNNNTTDVVVFEDDKNVYIDFYITTTVKKLLSDDGVLNSISEFVSPADSAGDKTIISDDALLYVENNLLNAFNLDMIKIYTSRVKGISSEILSSASVNNLDDGGYMNDTNFTFKSHEQKPLNFRLIYNKRLGYSYRIRPMIKIKS